MPEVVDERLVVVVAERFAVRAEAPLCRPRYSDFHSLLSDRFGANAPDAELLRAGP